IHAAEEIERGHVRARAELEASGIRLKLMPERSLNITPLEPTVESVLVVAGQPWEMNGTARLRLHIEGVGEISIQSGSRETAKLQAKATQMEADLQQILGRWKC